MPLGRAGEMLARGVQPARLALVALGQRDRHARLRGRAKCINLGHCIAGCAQGAKAQHRHHLLAGGAARAASSCARAAGCAEITVDDDGMATGVIYYDEDGIEQSSAPRSWSSPATASARRASCSTRSPRSFPDGLANTSGLVGKNLMFHPYGVGPWRFRRAARRQPRPAAAASGARSSTRPTAARGFVRGYTFQISRGVAR